jgi:hypothetical protein
VKVETSEARVHPLPMSPLPCPALPVLDSIFHHQTQTGIGTDTDIAVPASQSCQPASQMNRQTNVSSFLFFHFGLTRLSDLASALLLLLKPRERKELVRGVIGLCWYYFERGEGGGERYGEVEDWVCVVVLPAFLEGRGSGGISI